MCVGQRIKGLWPVLCLLLVCLLLTGMVSVPKESQTIVKSVELRGDEEFQYEVTELDYRLWGDIIAASLEELQVANASLLDSASVNESDILLTVDGVPLTRQEWNYRKEMPVTFPQRRTEQETLQVLIREKVKQAKAIEYGLLPTEEDIQTYLQMEKEMWQETEEGVSILQEFYEGALTVDDYWNIYERYNVTRLLIDSNLNQWYLDEQGLAYDAGESEAEVDCWVKEAKIVYRQKISWKLF